MLATDIVVVINAPSTGGDMALPTKLYEALALGRPVLALTRAGSDTARLLERLGQEAGLAPPDDPAAIAAAIERCSRPRRHPRPEALAEFDVDRIAARYAELLDEVATRSSSSSSRHDDLPPVASCELASASPSCRARTGSRTAQAAPLPPRGGPVADDPGDAVDLGQTAAGREHDRSSTGEGLQRRDRQPFARREQREHVGPANARAFSSSGIRPRKVDRITKPEPGG